MLVSEFVEINLKGSKPKYYELLGYIIPKKIGSKGKEVYDYSKPITVKVEDLSKGSRAEVLYTCDVCKKPISCMYKTYLRMKKILIQIWILVIIVNLLKLRKLI